MCFRTKIDIKKSPDTITHSSKIMLMGSCFADNIGIILDRYKFDCLRNPYGTLYNPLSISKSLREILDGKQYDENDLFYHNGLYHSFMHHSAFSSHDRQQCLEHINSLISKAGDYLLNSDWLVLTLGTSFVYEYNGEVVSNCHKMPEKSFRRSLCNVDTFVDEYRSLLDRLFAVNDKLKVVFTISPIRHIRDTLHGNMLSKSVLALFVNEIQNLYGKRVFYFPAYEIMNDDLRDYRFYEDDMLHPSGIAIKYIWDSFSYMFFEKKTFNIIERCDKIEKMLQHKPFNPESEQYYDFICRVKKDIDNLLTDYPSLDFCKETDYINSIIRRGI